MQFQHSYCFGQLTMDKTTFVMFIGHLAKSEINQMKDFDYFYYEFQIEKKIITNMI